MRPSRKFSQPKSGDELTAAEELAQKKAERAQRLLALAEEPIGEITTKLEK